jgi:pimeloyl-ACP methyl ester carboxylesterase
LVSTHTADAAAILEYLQATPAIVVGTSAGATIAVDLAVRRPDIVRAVIAHEAAWRASRHIPNAAQLAAVVKIVWLTLRGRHGGAAETLLCAAYTYRDGGTAWDTFSEEWRRIAREKRPASLAGLPKLHRQLSISGRSRERCCPHPMQLPRPQPQQHHPPDPLPHSGHPQRQNARN